MKRIAYLTLIGLLVCQISTVNAANNTYYTTYEKVELTEQQYNNLLELGFSENEIYYMNSELLNANKDIEATLVSEKVEYYKTTTITKNGISTSTSEKITQAQYNLGVVEQAQTRNGEIYDGTIETDYKTMRTSISQIDDSQFRYKVNLTWKNMPSKRSNDIIGLGFQQAYVKLNSPVFFQQHYTNSSGSHSSMTCIPIAGTMGGSAVFKLPSGSLSALSSFLYYNVVKKNDTYTVTKMDAGGDYSHATSTISETNAKKHSVNHFSGIELDSSIEKYYDSIPVATATWYGSW